ncbi:hypothetical protein [Pseudodesulfovibrio sp.]|uniref:hypothetical protein n=1 Tax=unclassified Pseudodesulfovibrio TaxID=2661612 RepID=UPI003AFF6349
MNDLLKKRIDDRLCALDQSDCNYNDHVNQFIKKDEWNNIYDDCIKLVVCTNKYILEKGVTDVVVFLSIALVQRHNFWVDYGFDLAIDIPNFVFDSGNTPPSLYIYRDRPQLFRNDNSEYYVRPLPVDKRLKKYDCVALYKCERDISDIKSDLPFYRDIEIKCYL